MRKQYPWIAIITGSVSIFAAWLLRMAPMEESFIITFLISWVVCTGILLIPEAVGCHIANRSSRPFVANRNSFICAGVLMLVTIGFVCWDLLGSRGYLRGFVAFLALITIGVPSLLSVIINTANLIYKRQLIKKSKYIQHALENHRRVRLRPFLPWFIALGIAMLSDTLFCLLVYRRFMFLPDYAVLSTIITIVLQLAIVVAIAEIIGTLVKQLTKISFVGNILALAANAYYIVTSIVYLGQLDTSAQNNAQNTYAVYAELILLCIFSVSEIVWLVLRVRSMKNRT